MLFAIIDAHLDRCLSQHVACLVGTHFDVVFDPFKVWFEGAGTAFDQQVEGCSGCFKLVAVVFHFDNPLEDAIHQVSVVFQVVAGRQRDDVGSS